MTNSFLTHLEQQLSEPAGKAIKIKATKQVYGGDISLAYIITTNERKYFIKVNHTSPADMFEKEYNGLKKLRSKSVLKIPESIMYGTFETDFYLLMECLERGKPTQQTWKELGEGLAVLHKQTQLQFGFEEDNYIGALPELNTLCDSWAEFYATQRILPLIYKNFEDGKCTKTDVQDAETICKKLADIFPDEPAALLHGDLWSGNFMACNTVEAAVYDPAVYYGHREMDIAMTLLFGGFDKQFYSDYNESYPLQNGWQNRVALCQLYPLLFHLNLFGNSYYKQVKRVLDMYK